MKLAYSTNAYTQTDLISAVRNISKIGYQGVEILCDTPHWLSHQVSDEAVAALRQTLNDTGLAISNLNANTANGYFDPLPPENVFEPSLSSSNDTWRSWRIDYTIKTLQLAKQLGANCISVTSGQPASGGKPETGLDILTESLKHICEHADKLGIRVGIEYEPGLLVERASELEALISRVDSPWLGANFDIGHSFLCGESAQDAVALLKGRIWNVHVEDIHNQKHYHLIPGEGELPFKEYFTALEAAGYDNYLTVELYTYSHQPDEAGIRSLNYLNTCFAAD
jgi:sugar phosphate isomerase/epimerase